MSQTENHKMAFVAIIIVDVLYGLMFLYVSSGFQISKMNIDETILLFVSEILLIQLETTFFPAIAVWRELRTIVKGGSAVLLRGEKLRKEATHSIYGLWCYSGYEWEELSEYFRKEKALMKEKPRVEFHRLMNVQIVGADKAKEHCDSFKEEIRSGRYVVTAVKYHSREFLIVDRKKLLILYQDMFSKSVGGGIGPCDERDMVAGFADEYEELERENKDRKLNITSEAEAQKNIADWIATTSK